MPPKARRIQQEWDLKDYLRAAAEQRAATIRGLDRWRDQGKLDDSPPPATAQVVIVDPDGRLTQERAYASITAIVDHAPGLIPLKRIITIWVPLADP